MPDAPKVTGPTMFEVEIYFSQKGFEYSEAEKFFSHYDAQNWTGKKGITVKNWRAKALDWMWQKQKNSLYQRVKSQLNFHW